jgi:hypothetical protein
LRRMPPHPGKGHASPAGLHLVTLYVTVGRSSSNSLATTVFWWILERSPTVVRLLLAAAPQVKNYGKKYFPLRLRRRLCYFLTATNSERRGNQDFARRELRLSNDSTPQASSSKCVQALYSDDATLSTPTADYEFHPYLHRIKRLRMRERACHSTTPYSICRFQGWSTNDDHQGNRQNQND